MSPTYLGSDPLAMLRWIIRARRRRLNRRERRRQAAEYRNSEPVRNARRVHSRQAHEGRQNAAESPVAAPVNALRRALDRYGR